MALAPTSGAIATLQANPSPDDVPEMVVQVVDLKKTGSRYMFMANDRKQKLRGILPSACQPEITSGKIQNSGLIRLTGYSLNDIPSKNETHAARIPLLL